MIQALCIAFLFFWSFWTWAADTGEDLIDRAIFAFPFALGSTIVVGFIWAIVYGAFGGFTK